MTATDTSSASASAAGSAAAEVTQAQGWVLTNKYAGGYPGRRPFGDCEHVDAFETLAIERATLDGLKAPVETNAAHPLHPELGTLS